MADLVRGRYPVTNELWSLLGQATNATQSDIAVRTNASFFGMAGLTDASALTSVKANFVAVPVEYGDIITKCTVLVGATAQSGGSHSNFALYTGGTASPTLITGSQSTDVTAAAGGTTINTALTVTFGTPTLITPTNAPYGYIYVSYGLTATTPPSLAAWSIPTAVYYQTSALSSATAAPLALAGNVSGGGATAAANLASPTAVSTAFAVFLQ